METESWLKIPVLNTVRTENKTFAVQSNDLRVESYIALSKMGKDNSRNPSTALEGALSDQFFSQGFLIPFPLNWSYYFCLNIDYKVSCGVYFLVSSARDADDKLIGIYCCQRSFRHHYQMKDKEYQGVDVGLGKHKDIHVC